MSPTDHNDPKALLRVVESDSSLDEIGGALAGSDSHDLIAEAQAEWDEIVTMRKTPTTSYGDSDS